MTRSPTILLAAALSLLAACASGPSPAHASDGDARIWHIKAIRPDGSFVDVKALDSDGRILDVKALETPGNLHVMDVKALRDGARLDVKLVPRENGPDRLRAIAPGGQVLEIAGLPPEGGRLPVLGLRRDGNLTHIKALDADGSILPIKAISPEGHLMDVKGLRFAEAPIAATVRGVAVSAHVKAIPQVTEPAAVEKRWHVRAIHPDGRTLPVRAVGVGGTTLPIEAIEVPGNQSLMDVKALNDRGLLGVKIVSEDGAMKAIGPFGTSLDVRAVEVDGTLLEVRAVRRAGNIFDVKAIGPDGRWYGVKALSADGFLHDVKGVKVTDEEIEGREGDAPFFAHVKALPQVIGTER